MNAFVAVTDFDWFSLLASQQGLTEVNFWQPSGHHRFSAINQNELFLFKLHSPRNYIVGGGFFAHSTLLPVSLAWETFGVANGAASLQQMRAQIEQYREQKTTNSQDYTIGCIVLSEPFFFSEANWIAVPNNWSPNITQGKRYDLSIEPGASLFRQLNDQLLLIASSKLDQPADTIREKYGKPFEISPRLGQGGFRFVVIDAYERQCAVTGEKVLPVLVAGHIKPYAGVGTHNPNNGILLRSDLHTLFDKGYVTITPDYRFEVSKMVREEFENGHEYYALHGQNIHIPKVLSYRPSPEILTWHNENVFRG